jgi:hypothetical protein
VDGRGGAQAAHVTTDYEGRKVGGTPPPLPLPLSCERLGITVRGFVFLLRKNDGLFFCLFVWLTVTLFSRVFYPCCRRPMYNEGSSCARRGTEDDYNDNSNSVLQKWQR